MSEVQNVPPQSPWPNLKATPTDPNQDPNLQTYANLQKQLQEYALKSKDIGDRGIAENKALQERVNNMPVQTDLTSLMSLADAWSGSNLAQTYKPPTTPAERIGMLQKILAEIDKRSDNMDDNQIKILKSQLETQAQKEHRMYQIDAVKAQKDIAQQNFQLKQQEHKDEFTLRQQQHKDDLAQKNYQTAFDKWESDTKEDRKKLKEAEGLKNTYKLALYNPITAKGIPIEKARFSVPSRLNETEIHAYGYLNAGDFETKVQQAVTNLRNGALTPQMYKYLMDDLEMKEKHIKDSIQKDSIRHATIYSKKTGKPLSDAYSELTDSPLPDVTKAAEAPTDSGNATRVVGQIYDGYKYLGGPIDQESSYQEVK